MSKHSIRIVFGQLIAATVLAAFFSCAPCACKHKVQKSETPAITWDITTQYRLLGTTINLGNALDAPKEGDWGVVLTENYFKHVRELGFNSVRIPVRWSTHIDTIAPFSINETFFARVKWAVDQALANNLRAIVNVHHFEQLMSDPVKNTPAFLAIWEQVATRFASYGPELYFELCNEPNGALTTALWNDLAAKSLAIVRKANPTRSVIIGGTGWNSADGLKELVLPADSFIIATFHCYDPAPFTHQGASWLKGADLWKGLRWRATPTEKALLVKTFDSVDKWSKAHNTPVFLGEFGALDTADNTSRILYTSFIAKEAVSRGWSYAYWKYSGNFGIYDDSSKVTRQDLTTALLKPDSTFNAVAALAKNDTIATPAIGNEKSLLIDDFDDTLPRQNALVNSKLLFGTLPYNRASSCYWNAWYKDSSALFAQNGSRVPPGTSEVAAITTAAGHTGKGLFVKAHLLGSSYPSINVSTGFPGSYNQDWFDLSALTAVSFYAKGKGIWTIDIITDTIQNGFPPSDNWGQFSFTFEPSDTWKLFVIPVAALHPKPWSRPQQEMLPWSAAMKKACTIQFASSQNYGNMANDSLELGLDEIRLHGLTDKELLPFKP